MIRIGISTLAFSQHERAHRHYESAPLKVCDEMEFARDVAKELKSEEEDGTTPLHLLLDKACEEAENNGSTGLLYEDPKTAKSKTKKENIHAL